MTAKTVSLQEAESHLRELLDLAGEGEEVLIAVDAVRHVRLVPVPPVSNVRRFGQHRGQARMHKDFDEPLPEDFLLGSKP